MPYASRVGARCGPNPGCTNAATTSTKTQDQRPSLEHKGSLGREVPGCGDGVGSSVEASHFQGTGTRDHVCVWRAPAEIFNGRVLRDIPSRGQCLTCCVPASHCATGTMGTAEQVADVRASIRPLRRRWPSVTKRSLMLEGASTDCLEPRARGLPACR